jgi:hypothetical protein
VTHLSPTISTTLETDLSHIITIAPRLKRGDEK